MGQPATRDDVQDSDPEWSPDGTLIVWIRYEGVNGGPTDIWVMNADASNKHNLTDDHANIYGPAWSPDGSTIAFSSSGDGGRRTSSSWIPTARIGGSRRTRSTSTSSIPHGHRMVTGWAADALASVHDTNSWHVDLIRADGSGEHILVQQYPAYTAWPPDGSRIAFYAFDQDCARYRITPSGRRFEPLGRHRGVADFDPDHREVIPTGWFDRGRRVRDAGARA